MDGYGRQFSTSEYDGAAREAAGAPTCEGHDDPVVTSDLYRFAVELSPAMPWIANSGGLLVEVDRRIAEMTGRTREACLDRGFMDSVHPDDAPVAIAAWQQAFETREPFDYDMRVRLRDGSYRWHRIRAAAYVESGQIRNWYGTLEDFHERKLAADAVAWVADHDDLTGLLNRRVFLRELHRLFDKGASEIMLALLDIDQLKPMNERFGNDSGDELLREVAKRLGEAAPENTLLARTGGGEFVLCLRAADTADTTDAALRRALAIFEGPFVLHGRNHKISASVGIARHPRDAEGADALFKSAQFALREARHGTGFVRHFDAAMRERHQRRLSAIFVAREALAKDDILPFYQPQINLATGEVSGFEALLRWRHVRHGIQPAGLIASAFDDPDLAAALDRRMFERIAEDMAGWRADGVPFGRIAINTSVVRFRSGSVAGELLSRIAASGLTPDLLELEITEDVLVDRAPQQLARDLCELREAGMTVALDDFGTGFASLIHLKQFAIDVLKIDRAFIQDMDDPANSAIVAALIRLGKQLSIRTVAEGVETPRQASRLRRKGCDFGQGFLFSPAVPAREVAPLIRALATRRREPVQPNPDIRGQSAGVAA